MKNYFFVLSVALLLPINIIFANAHNAVAIGFVPTKEIVKNLDSKITDLKKQTSLPVLWPEKISSPKYLDKLFASYSSYGNNPNYDQYWIISFDATSDCQGAHVCSVGFISAEKSAKIDKYYETLPGQKKYSKQVVKLKNNYIGYYTPLHIQAGSINPKIEWKDNNVLYTLSWKIDSPVSKKGLVIMANLVLENISKK